jgi:tRNA A-37 threonylcarbamoyl transferase component Bud32
MPFRAGSHYTNVVEVSPENVTVILGRYRLDSLIGEGGMASVWKAKDLTLARPVAVKILYARDDRDEQALVDQFLREARIAAAVQHRNVIHIVDFGTTAEGRPFMVMELLEGESLGARMHRGPPMELDEVVHVACMTLRGLQAVHDAGIIHRDLKPDNIFLKADGSGTFPKILDFGISRSVEPSSGRRSALTTKEGIIVGTPEYMSPEQARGLKDIDKRTDLYSMGVILYESLTGRLPFQSENIGDLIIQIVTATSQPAHEANPSVPLAVSRVIEKAMARSPGARYADATQMQQALLEAAESVLGGGNSLRRSISDMPPPMASMPARPISPAAMRPLGSPPPPAPAAAQGQQAVGSELLLGDVEVGRELELAVEPAEVARGITLDIDVEPARGGFRRRDWLFALAVIGAAGSAWALGLLDASEPESVTVTVPPAAAPVIPTTPVVAPAPLEPELLTVRLRNVPPGASVTLDDQPAAGDSLEMPKDGKPRVIKVSAPNKVAWQVVHASTDSAVYDVWLADKPVAKPAAARPPASARPRGKQKPAPGALRQLDF